MEPTEGFGFDVALRWLKSGAFVQRDGWNGKGLAVGMQTPDALSRDTLPYLFIAYPSNHTKYPAARCPWLASQTDLLADDWRVLAVPEGLETQ